MYFNWKTGMALLLMVFAPLSLAAQDQADDDNSRVRLDFRVNSGYLWRGIDIYSRSANHYERRGEGTLPGSFNVVPNIQPDITFINVLPGASGTYVRVGVIYPLTHREAEEYDEVTCALGALCAADATGPGDATAAGLERANASLAGNRQLESSDLLYGILGFRRPTRVGVVGAGLLFYRYPNSIATQGDNIEEVFFDYNPPGPTFLRPLRFMWFSSISRGWIGTGGENVAGEDGDQDWVQDWDYFKLSYGFPIPLDEDLRLTWEVSVAYFIYTYFDRDEAAVRDAAIASEPGLQNLLGEGYEPELAVLAAAGQVPVEQRGSQGLANIGFKVGINYSGFYFELEGFSRDPERSDLYYLFDDYSRNGKTFDRSKEAKTVQELYDNQADLPSFIARVSLGYQTIL